jgi:hypothetical protein
MKSCLKTPVNRQFSATTLPDSSSTQTNRSDSAHHLHQSTQSKQVEESLNEQDYIKFATYKNNLSKMIKHRYNSEPYAPQLQSNMPTATSSRVNTATSRNKHMPGTARDQFESQTSNENADQSQPNEDVTNRPKSGVNQHVYGKHIDSLTAELLAVFSKEYNRGLFENASKLKARDQVNDYDELDDFIQVCDDRDSNTDTGTLRNPLDMGFFDDDDDEDEEDDDVDDVDDNEEYLNYEDYQHLFCNTNLSAVNSVDPTHEYVDYEDDRMILATNIKERDFSRDNIVMKICNEIRAEIGQNKKLSKRMRKRLRMLEMFDVNRLKMENYQVVSFYLIFLCLNF